MKYIKIASSAWSHFWFESAKYERLGLMRLVLAGTLFVTYFGRQFRMDFFNELSFLPADQALNVFPDYYRPLFPWFFWPDAWAGTVHLIFLILLFGFFTGVTNRFFMLLTWVLAMGFIHRNYAVLFGADVIGALFLFYLSFTKCYKNYSVLNIFKTKSLKVINEVEKPNSFFAYLKSHFNWSDFKGPYQEQDTDAVSSAFYRLAQFQICAIYAYTGFEKLKGVSWWNGSALWTVFANPQMVVFDMTWMRHFAFVIALITYVTIIFEIYFPMALFVPKLKKYWLFAGLFFHLGIGILMGLMPFSLVMLSPYFLLFDFNGFNKNSNAELS